MNLTAEQEALLNHLLHKPAWVSLLDALKTERPVKPWKPSRPEDNDEQRKNSQWVFESGIQRGFNEVVEILGRGKI